MFKSHSKSLAVGSYGFTLVELMIAVAIVGIISTFAIPSYSNYMIRSRLTEAPPQLLTASAKMERTYLDNRAYTCPGAVTDTRFTVTCTGDATSFTLTASNLSSAGLGSAGDYKFTLNQLGVRGTTAFPSTTGSTTCWLADKNGSCF